MLPTEALTPLGILRRQRPLAEAALARYPLDVRRLTLISHDTNYIYRVTAADGARYALRLVAPYWRTADNLRAEVAWLDALARDTNIAAPRIVRTAAGEPFTHLTPGHGRPTRRAVVMTWLPGMSLGRRLNAANVAKMGALFASLHRHAGSWRLPDDFPRQRFDAYLSRGEENVLFSEVCTAAYSAADQRTLEDAVARVEAAYRALDRADLRVIHCDLWHANIKLYRGALAPFDFEDTILGFRLHDIAMALLDLAETIGDVRYAELLGAFIGGYESILPFPAGDLLGLQLGRVLWKVNWFGRFAARHFAAAAGFQIGVLRRALAAERLVGPLRPG